MNTTLWSPATAAAAAVAPARLPVEAQARVSKPNSTARAAAMATTRSLNERVGLRLSSLSQIVATPRALARRSARTSAVPPTARPRAGGASTGSNSR